MEVFTSYIRLDRNMGRATRKGTLEFGEAI